MTLSKDTWIIQICEIRMVMRKADEIKEKWVDFCFGLDFYWIFCKWCYTHGRSFVYMLHSQWTLLEKRMNIFYPLDVELHDVK